MTAADHNFTPKHQTFNLQINSCCRDFKVCFSFRLQALRNEQERTLADMRERHEQDTHKVNEKLEREVVAEEAQAVELLKADEERKLRELKDRHAAELAARSKDMSPEEVQQVFRKRCLFLLSKMFRCCL